MGGDRAFFASAAWRRSSLSLASSVSLFLSAIAFSAAAIWAHGPWRVSAQPRPYSLHHSAISLYICYVISYMQGREV